MIRPLLRRIVENNLKKILLVVLVLLLVSTIQIAFNITSNYFTIAALLTFGFLVGMFVP